MSTLFVGDIQSFEMDPERVIATLARISQLSQIVEEGGESVESLFSRLEQVRKGFFETLEQFREFVGPVLAHILEMNPYYADNAKSITHVAIRMLKDLFSISVPPVIPAMRGVNGGPTLLVQYTRPSHPDPSVLTISYVLKWTHWSEFHGQRLYHAVLNVLEPFGGTCSIPCASLFDETTYQYICFSQTPRSLSDPKQFQTHLSQVRCYAKPGAVQKGKQVLISAKVKGSTLFDFIAYQYGALSESSRELFFLRLGEIAMLDLAMGQSDRLLRRMWNGDAQSNLGNVMVDFAADSSLHFYLIDNELLRENFEKNRSVLYAPKFEELGAQLQDEIGNSLNGETIPDFDRVKEAIVRFKQDLRTERYRMGLVKGFQNMAKGMKEKLCELQDACSGLVLGDDLKKRLGDLNNSPWRPKNLWEPVA